MYWKKYRMMAVVACLFLLVQGLSAQYKVTGGSKTPLLATDDTRNRIEVYMVYGTDGVEISYTAASSTSHQWYRYNTRALDAEKITATQQGNTSVIGNIEEGYGYFVQESDQVTRYVWIIDYSQHAFDISNLQVDGGTNPCSTFRLTGTATMDPLSYNAPNGTPMPVNRVFSVSYSSLQWNETQRSFSREDVIKTVEGDPFATTYAAPLCDTPVKLSGDSFATYFGVGKTMQTDDYTAVAIEVHADTTLLSSSDSPNQMTGGDALSAPADILFTAYANDPVAAMYTWTIYKERADGTEEQLLLFKGEEIDYEFKNAGKYRAALQVSDRSGKCTDTSNSFSFSIADFKIWIPNAFSPGSSPGINDEFFVTYRSIYHFKGWIFNRWGAEIFHWTNPDQSWDGKKGGKYVPAGVYYYVIEFEGSDGSKHKRRGDINILRPKSTQ